MQTKPEGYDIWQVIEHIGRTWYVLIILGLAGALIGYLAACNNPPLYEATSVLSVGLNFDQTPHLSQYEEDFALGKLASVVIGDDVFAVVLQRYGQETQFNDLPLDVADLRGLVVMERKGSRWELKVRGQHPEHLAWLANTWAEAGQSAYQEAFLHAVQALDLQSQRQGLNAEIVQLTSAESISLTEQAALDEIETRLMQLDEEFVSEMAQARGVTTYLSLEWTEQAFMDDKPLVGAHGTFILVGNLIGIIVGLSILLITLKPNPSL